MKLADFRAKDKKSRIYWKEKASKFKLEKVLSLWYFIRSSSKATIIGSRGIKL